MPSLTKRKRQDFSSSDSDDSLPSLQTFFSRLKKPLTTLQKPNPSRPKQLRSKPTTTPQKRPIPSAPKSESPRSLPVKLQKRTWVSGQAYIPSALMKQRIQEFGKEIAEDLGKDLSIAITSDKEIITYQETTILLEIRITREGSGAEEVAVKVKGFPKVNQEVDVSVGRGGWMKVDAGDGGVVDLTGDGEEDSGGDNRKGKGMAGPEKEMKEKIEDETVIPDHCYEIAKEGRILDMEIDEDLGAEFRGAEDRSSSPSPSPSLVEDTSFALAFALPDQKTIKDVEDLYEDKLIRIIIINHQQLFWQLFNFRGVNVDTNAE